MKIIYTDSADIELKKFLDSQRKTLEESIAREKSVPGDEILEITASDIKTAAMDLNINRLTRKKQNFATLISKAYIFIGMVIASGAYFYPEIQFMISENRMQAALFVSGLFVAAIGYLFGEWNRISISRRASAEQNFIIKKSELSSSELMIKKYIDEFEGHQGRLEDKNPESKEPK